LGTPFSSYLAGLQMPAPMPKLSCFDSCHTHVRGTCDPLLVKHVRFYRFWSGSVHRATTLPPSGNPDDQQHLKSLPSPPLSHRD
jgi:hypothetical protein